MIWSFRGITTFSLYPPRISDVSLVENPTNPPSVPLNASSTIASLHVIHSPTESQAGLVTPQDFKDNSHATTQLWLCSCERQETDFCPYCDFERTVLKEAFDYQGTPPSTDSSSLKLEAVELPNTSTHRKLRKIRSNYQQLRYEALAVESILAARPDSVISDNSRTPLLNPFLPPSLNYAALPPARRSRNKLEKKDKKGRSVSLPSGSTPITSATITQRGKIIMSRSFQKSKSREILGPRPKPISSSIDTDTLVALAWTGEPLSPVKSSETIISKNNGSTSPTSPCSRPSSVKNMEIRSGAPAKPHSPDPTPMLNQKRSVLRKPRESDDPAPSANRPWTFAMTITDDGITDEKLVDDLEDMRIKEVVGETTTSDPYPLGLGPPPFYQTQLYDSYAEYPLQADEASQEDAFPIDSSWNAARQVFLLCREFVRTERRYLASLKTLITNGTSSPPPPAMLPYLPGLITASDQLLERMEENPSVQGVSDAFLASENILKQSFIDWCSVVGQFFDSNEKMKHRVEPEDASMSTSSSSSSPKLLRSPRSRPVQMRTDSNLSVVIPEPNKIRKNTKARPAVRDLAILPTQRIMRYVLLFKEFYSLTPTTLPSFIAVEKALRAAQSIANASNKAQGHSAFEQPPIHAS